MVRTETTHWSPPGAHVNRSFATRLAHVCHGDTVDGSCLPLHMTNLLTPKTLTKCQAVMAVQSSRIRAHLKKNWSNAVEFDSLREVWSLYMSFLFPYKFRFRFAIFLLEKVTFLSSILHHLKCQMHDQIIRSITFHPKKSSQLWKRNSLITLELLNLN